MQQHFCERFVGGVGESQVFLGDLVRQQVDLAGTDFVVGEEMQHQPGGKAKAMLKRIAATMRRV